MTVRPSLRSGFQAALRALVALAVLAMLEGCARETTPALQGYVEGEFAMVAAPAGGTLAKLQVQRGDLVAPGAPLFVLESANEEAARAEAAERVRGAEQRLANLRTGHRPPEIDVVRAQADEAAAARKLSVAQLQQQEKLFASGFISKASLDQARANYDRDMARLAEAAAQGRVAQLSLGRDAEIRAAAADVDAARAVLAQGDWRLEQRKITAPVSTLTGASENAGAGGEKLLVQDTFFNEGEWVPAGRPVVSLLPPGRIKVRFFVPEQQVGAIKQGDRVSIACDGCGAPIPATVSFISKQSEYTPPILYNKDSRAKLVFMIEARPSPQDAVKLRPGQPVDVSFPDAPGTGGGNSTSKSTAP